MKNKNYSVFFWENVKYITHLFPIRIKECNQKLIHLYNFLVIDTMTWAETFTVWFLQISLDSYKWYGCIYRHFTKRYTIPLMGISDEVWWPWRDIANRKYLCRYWRDSMHFKKSAMNFNFISGTSKNLKALIGADYLDRMGKMNVDYHCKLWQMLIIDLRVYF